MNKNFRKMTTLGLATVLACTAFVGCGAKAETDKAADAETTVETTDTKDVAVATEAPAAEAAALPKDYEGTLTMWGWDENYYKTMTTAFNKIYPNVKFEYTPVANGDLLQKYQTALAAGTELPDIGWSIVDSRAKVYELDMWEPLNKAPYNFDINGVFDYLKPIMVNSTGDVCGIEQSVAPAGMAYRKDLAKEYFGTDDPQKLAEMLPTWDAFIEKGIEVKEKSAGKVYMWTGIADAQQFIRNQNDTPWIQDDKINMTAGLTKSIDLATKFRDAGIVDTLEAWSPAWYASFGEGKHMFAGCATWTSQFVIQPNDTTGKTEGHWGLMSAPEGNISWGGTTLGITKTAKDKPLAWEFIKFATVSTEGAKALNTIGLLTSAKAPYEEDATLKSIKDAWFGDQDTGKFFIDTVIPNIKLRAMNVDDNIIHDSLNMITTAINNDKTIDTAKAMKLLKEELEIQLPDYTVE